jgi:hypothetical protein
MPISHDADTETVVRETVAAIKESALHIGKADRTIELRQIEEIEAAVRLLQGMLTLKKRANASRSERSEAPPPLRSATPST